MAIDYMNAETAIDFINLLLQQQPQSKKESLTYPDKLIIQGVWNRQQYDSIAHGSMYSEQYLRTVGGKLWEIIGKLLSTEVNKFNVKQLIEKASSEQAKEPTEETQETLSDWRKAKKIYPSWQAHREGIGGVAVSTEQQTFATGSWDGTIQLWNLSTAKLIRALTEPGQNTAHLKDVAALIFTPNSETLISASYDRTIKLWKLDTGELLSTLRKDTNNDRPQIFFNHTKWVEAIALSNDGQVLASGSFDRSIYLWDLQQHQELKKLQSKSEILTIAFSPDGWQLACGCLDGTIQLWDLRSIESNPRKFAAAPGWISSLVFSFDSNRIYSGNEHGTIAVWDVHEGAKIDNWQCNTSAVLTLAFHPKDANILVSGSYDRSIVFWNLLSRKPLHTLPPHDGGITTMSFDLTGNTLIVGDELGNITLWQTLDFS